ncbi:FAD:protein FMN transferase [Desulfosporosinus sp.]|uniref:FAD:protein FMN transferase n=1 Tax=Desulfosporosinus sp. TaxID=157907 RepID=UPI00262E468A|nr:FAD:protein FMN transferase [Desulfosporosinus sp.]
MKKVVGITFEAMNTTINVRVISSSEWVEKLRKFLNLLPSWFVEVEAVLSRFDPQSELARINTGADGTYQVSNILADVVYLALNAAKVTNGIFDPTILRKLEQAGYDCTFQEVMDRTETGLPVLVKENVQKARCGRMVQSNKVDKTIKIDRRTGSLVKLNGIGLDLGGIAKGWAVDQIFGQLRHLSEQAEICVNAGGDLRLVNPSEGKPWFIKVENPLEKGENLLSLRLNDGAVATSNVLKRRWKHEGQWQHHLIDPRTGSPSQSTVVAATVVAATTVEAEVWAKTLCILGIEKGLELLRKQANLGALVLSHEGELIINEKMRGVIDAGISGPASSIRF